MKKLFGTLVFVGVVIGGLVMGGYVVVGDFTSVQPRDLQKPDAGVSDSHLTKLGLEEFQMESQMWINNTLPVGTNIDTVEYLLYWSPERNSSYSYLGEGNKSNLTVPPQSNNTHTLTTTLPSDEGAQAYKTMQEQGYIWVKVDAEAEFAFYTGVSIAFTQKVRVER